MPVGGNRRVAAVVAVYVTPRAARSEIVGRRAGAIWVRLAAPPVEGRANAALIELFAARLGVPRSAVEVVGGASSRSKRLGVDGLTAAEVERRLLTR